MNVIGKTFALILLLALLAFFVNFLFTLEKDGHQHKYLIKDTNGVSYSTNSFVKDGECISFESEGCGCFGIEDKKNKVKICGNYSIKEYSDYKPNK